MREVVDHLGRKVQLKEPVERLVSICPSQTETIIELGAGERLVGRSRFCIAPKAAVKSIPAIGGTKEIDLAKVKALQPDLVIAEKEENTPEIVESLSAFTQVFVTDVTDYESSLRMIQDLGNLLGQEAAANAMTKKIRERFAEIDLGSSQDFSVLYFIWQKPFMVAGAGTFIDSMLQKCGLRNLGSQFTDSRYPQISEAQLQELRPDFCLLSSEPFPFSDKHIENLRQILPDTNAMLVSGELFSWYGASMLEMPNYFKNLRKVLLDSSTVKA